MLKAERLMRIKFSLVLALLICTVVATLRTHAQSAGEIWSVPLNLSQSGAASEPGLVPGGPSGWRVIWMDRFDGLTSARQVETGWEAPTAMSLTISITLANDESRRVAVTETPEVTADSQGNLHLLWLEPSGSQIGLAVAAEAESDNDDEQEVEEAPQTILFYSRMSGDGERTEPVALARAIVDWQLVEDANGQLYLFYLRTGHEESAPAGLYYVRSANGGSEWSTAQLINANIYLRLLVANDAHIQAITVDPATWHVVWDDPHLQRSLYVRSPDGGTTWSEPQVIGAVTEPVKSLHVAAGAEGVVLRLWDATPEGTLECILYQQKSADGGVTWSAPERVLETLSPCPATWRLLASGQRNVFWVGNEGGESVAIAAWDGTQWSDVRNLDLRFAESVAGTPLNLTALQVALRDETLGVVGTGQEDGEVWFLESELNAFEWAFAPPPAWSEPISITSSDVVGDSSSLNESGSLPGLPAIAIHDGIFHMVWSESLSPSRPPNALYYSTGSGDSWSSPAPLRFVSLPGTDSTDQIRADELALVGIGEQLHLVWSGGEGGQVLHSVTALNAVPARWSEPRPISPHAVVACCPSFTADSRGVLHIVYAVPLNERRGLYYTRSEDTGTTWSEPIAIVDAAAEGWEMVTQPRVAVDTRGHIHVSWLRGVAPGTQFGRTEGIYYAHSRDSGENWSEPTQLMRGLYEWPLLHVQGAGRLFVIGRESDSSLEWFSRRSDDGGIGWADAEPIPGFVGVPGPVGLASDGGNVLYLLGLRQQGEGESRLVMSTWNSSRWSPPETYDLNVNSQPGVAAVLDGAVGRLIVSFRRIVEEDGVENRTLWTTDRAVPILAITPEPTFTPQPTQTPLPAVQPTVTATPPLDLSTIPPITPSDALPSSTPLIFSAVLATTIVGGIVVIRSARRP